MKNLLHLYNIAPSKRKTVVNHMKKAGIQVYFSSDEISIEYVDYILVGAYELQKEQLEKFTRLRLIQIIGTNTDLIDLNYCESHHIKVEKTTYPRGYIIAEHAIGLALQFIRNIYYADQAVRNYQVGSKQKTFKSSEVEGSDNWPSVTCSTLMGANVGILGFGTIALELNNRLQSFGCNVSYNKRVRFSLKSENKLKIQFQTLDEILKSDIIFIHLGLYPQTENLISENELRLIKSNAIIVNCGRAGVFNEQHLLSFLALNPLVRYATDVFWQEPLHSSHPITKLSNVILTPHMAEQGGEDISQQRPEALNKIIAFKSTE